MSEKSRKVTNVGVVKESSELLKEREVSKQGGKWPAQPVHEKKSVEVEQPKENEKEEEEKE
jgi:hypothetical protein